MTSSRSPVAAAASARRRADHRARREVRAADGGDAATLILGTHRLLIRNLDRILRPYGLTFARYEVLSFLVFAPGHEAPGRELSDHFRVHPTSISNAVGRLARADRPWDRPTSGQATPRRRVTLAGMLQARFQTTGLSSKPSKRLRRAQW